MIDFGELRSACHSGKWSFELWQWITVSKVIRPESIEMRYAYDVAGRDLRRHDLLLAAITEVQQGRREDIASVVYLILAGGHREHWMRYAMAQLSNVEHETTNAADLVWWMCSHAPDLHERILDAGHMCDAELVWEFLAQFAYWELVRPENFGGYESPGCTAYNVKSMPVFVSWPCSKCTTSNLPAEDWGIYVRDGDGEHIVDLRGVGVSMWREEVTAIIEATRKAMKGDA